MTKYLIGVDLGGTKILSGLATTAGTILQSSAIPTEALTGKTAVIKKIIQSIDGLIATNRIDRSAIAGVGIGAPGFMKQPEGIIMTSPNLPGWKRVPLRALVEKEIKLPTFLENDANAAALGEWQFGAGRGSNDMIYVTISTGIGGGLIMGGKLQRGHLGMAGEIGHTIIDPAGPRCGCGKNGCLEALASGTALAFQARRLANKKNSRILRLANDNPERINAELVEQAARDGDALAKSLIDDVIDKLAIGLSNLANIINPERIVIGGGMTKMGKMLFAPLQKRVNALTGGPVKIVPAQFGQKAGLMGAVALCMQAE